MLYVLCRGIEPHEGFEGHEMYELFAEHIYPELSDTRLDKVIEKCWAGGYSTLADLAKEMADLDGATAAPPAQCLDKAYLDEMKAKRQRLMETDLADLVRDMTKDKSTDGWADCEAE